MDTQITSSGSGEELFRANLDLIDHVVAGVCRRGGLQGADAEDFASAAKLALMEDGYRILREYQGRSSLATFLTIVVHRLLIGEWIRMRGKWRSSAEARRLGKAAVLLEQLLFREGHPLEQTLALMQGADPSLDHAAVRRLAARLPERPVRARFIVLSGNEQLVAAERADARIAAAEARAACRRAARRVRRTLAAFSERDRMLIRLHFGAELSVADIARVMGTPQRPLYRRIDVLLGTLRTALESAGIDGGVVGDFIDARATEGIDFDLRERRSLAVA